MLPITNIRQNVFGCASQTAFADIVGVTQATVSRWETDEIDIGSDSMKKIREAARERGIAWDDRWFFEVPERAA